MDGQQVPNANGMINGGAFAGMIIIGGIIGDVILYTYLFHALGFPIVFGIGLVLVIIAAFMIQKSTKISGLLYLFILLGCMVIPLFGGIALYAVARSRKLTL